MLIYLLILAQCCIRVRNNEKFIDFEKYEPRSISSFALGIQGVGVNPLGGRV